VPKLFTFLICLWAITFSHDSAAWGRDGHRLVCDIAEKQLTDNGKIFLARMMSQSEFLYRDPKEDEFASSFAESCLWADNVKYGSHLSTYENHFINLPRGADKLDLNRDCVSTDCILAAIQRAMVYLATPAGGSRELGRQAAALRFLGHYIGDLHQPLHVSHAEDWGGNKIKVQWFGEDSNLHRIWDYGMIEQRGLKYPESTKSLITPMPKNTIPADIVNWAQDSFELALLRAYRGPSGELIEEGDELGSAYYQHNLTTVTSQLSLAGNRLAGLINLLALENLTPQDVQLIQLAPVPVGSRD